MKIIHYTNNKSLGFILLEQIIASIIFALFFVEFNQLQLYLVSKQMFTIKKNNIETINNVFMQEIFAISHHYNHNNIVWSNFTETNYPNLNNKISSCNNTCNINEFIREIISNWHQQLQQISPQIKSIICLDSPPYSLPQSDSAHCSNHGNFVLKIFWQHFHESYTNIIKIQ